jgi:Transposase DDE domain
MPKTASAIWDSWSAIATRLPADLDLDQLARSSGAILRRRGDGIGDAASLLQLIFARGPGGKSLQDTVAWARMNGGAELAAQSLNARLHQSVAFLDALLHRLLTARHAGKPLLWSGRCLRIADGSSLSQPGSKGTDWRLHGVYDLGSGSFSHLEITDQRGAESLLRCAPATNEVRIADRGYAKAKDLRAFLAQSDTGGQDFIVRVGWKALAWSDAKGDPFNLIHHLQTYPAGTENQEWAVQAQVGSTKRPSLLPLRLIAVPLPPDRAEAARRRVKRTASKHQDRTDPRTLLAAGFMVLVTSLPANIPAAEIYAVYRLRWQIELAFKRLKSLLHVDRLPTRTRGGSLSWLYAHLILLLLAEDICHDVLESSPSGARCRWPAFALARVQDGT